MVGKNNPFNIRYTKANRWLGQTGHTNGFCDFSEMAFGIRAALYLFFKSYKRMKVVTVRDVITRFAPPSENDTKRYIEFVCTYTKLLPDDKIDWCPISFPIAVSIYEGNSVTKVDILNTIKRFNLKY